MKIAVASTGPTLEHYVGTRLGRCTYILIVDLDTMRYEPIVNPLVNFDEVEVTAFTNIISNKGVTAVMAGRCDADLLKKINDSGIKTLIGFAGSVQRTLERFRSRNIPADAV